MEQNNVFDTYNFKFPFWHDDNRDEMMAAMPMYYCASDRGRAFWEGDAFPRARGNYVVCFGNGSFPGTGGFYSKFMPAPFTDHTDKSEGRAIRSFVDGLSNTMLMSEIIMAANDPDVDARGDILNNHPGHAEYMTFKAPNSGIDNCNCGAGQSTLQAPCTQSSESNVVVAARSFHPGGVHILLGDGSVRFENDDVDLRAWQLLGSLEDAPVAGGVF